MQSYPDLEGKVIVVTGGGSGMGRDVCLALGQAGARVVLGNRNQLDGQAVADQIRAQGGVALFQQTDVARSTECA
ncbi:MAG: SDR family NAD(P)-dependent oxidoreductase, partial [Parazoarcus communis]